MGGALVLAAADPSLNVDGLILVAAVLSGRAIRWASISGGLSFFAHTVPLAAVRPNLHRLSADRTIPRRWKRCAMTR